MDRWQAVPIFVQVAETGSFAETARYMNMNAPAVTRSVAALGIRMLLAVCAREHNR